MTQKETLWINIYTETIKEFSPIKAESAATKAVEAFERRFDKEINKIENILNSGNKVTFTPFKNDVDPAFTQAGRLKRLFEEFGFSIECHNEEDVSTIYSSNIDVLFHFENGEFKFTKTLI